MRKKERSQGHTRITAASEPPIAAVALAKPQSASGCLMMLSWAPLRSTAETIYPARLPHA